MTHPHSWFWQIKETGGGPDYFFSATFIPSDGARLADIVKCYLPVFYVYDADNIFSGNAHFEGCGTYERYCDQHTYERVRQLKVSNTQENIYHYAEIQVCDHQLYISHVLSGGTYDDTALVTALAQSPDLTLKEWTIGYSGYATGIVAHGVDSQSLLSYLLSRISFSVFSKVDTVLRW